MSHSNNPVQFTRYPVRMKDLTLVHSICLKCGASKLLSSNDGSLEEWEQQHQCKLKMPADVAA
jgi:hypothetical protein